MKIYIVVGEDYGGMEIGEVFFDKQLAEETVAEKNKFKGMFNKYIEYSVLEKETLDKRPITKKDKLAIVIEGYITLSKEKQVKNNIEEIYQVVAEKWCKNRFDDISSDIIAVKLFIKATEEDFDLNQEELKQKYSPVWEEICTYTNQLNKEGMVIEDIVEKLEEKYKVEW